jgi:TatA/E family protein of Tat protein translocase
VILLLVVLVVFGAKKVPETARSLGAAAREFRKGLTDGVAADPSSDEEPS